MPRPVDWRFGYEPKMFEFDSLTGCQFRFMDICFWCKRQKGEGEGDKPEYFNYDLCESCESQASKGVMVVQVTDKPNGNKPINNHLFPTGKWVVVDEIKGSQSETIFINEDTWKEMKLPN